MVIREEVIREVVIREEVIREAVTSEYKRIICYKRRASSTWNICLGRV